MGLSDIAAGLTGRFSGDAAGSEDDEGELGGELDGDDEFGDIGGWDDEDGEGDDFDDLGGSEGGSASDLEPRLDELENEMEAISSTMGTVRSENEAISETVEDIEDNIRKLLEIYEMVTRGVNPFVDEAEGAAGVGGSFGLFDGGDDVGGSVDDLDPDVADADAESFFDDDWDDDEFLEDDDLDVDEIEAAADGDVENTGAEEGKTFEDLKSEYEEGGEGWDDAGETDPGETEPPTGAADAGGHGGSEPSQDDEGSGGVPEPDDEPSAGGDSDGKPYLRELPTGYGADLLVMEWLSYLRSCSSTAETFRAIRYYETVDWIGPAAAESLTQYLTGLSDGEIVPAPEGATQLTVDHHTRSLDYIGKLGGADVRTDRLEWTGTPGRGVRREGGEQRGIQR